MEMPSWKAKDLTPGQLSERSGVAVSALHFYERQGLIESLRTPGNQRRYARAVLRRVAVIKVAQRMGVPLAEIAEALQNLPSGRTPTQADWAALSSVPAVANGRVYEVADPILQAPGPRLARGVEKLLPLLWP